MQTHGAWSLSFSLEQTCITLLVSGFHSVVAIIGLHPLVVIVIVTVIVNSSFVKRKTHLIHEHWTVVSSKNALINRNPLEQFLRNPKEHDSTKSKVGLAMKLFKAFSKRWTRRDFARTNFFSERTLQLRNGRKSAEWWRKWRMRWMTSAAAGADADAAHQCPCFGHQSLPEVHVEA